MAGLAETAIAAIVAIVNAGPLGTPIAARVAAVIAVEDFGARLVALPRRLENGPSVSSVRLVRG
jgi:hypothetical protein